MESVNLDMEDIFDEHSEEEDFPSVGPLPDLPEGEEGTEREANGEDDENSAEVLSRLKDLSKGAAKKVVRKPQPKLDATRLTGDRGLPILPKVFEDVKFKGKGHEAQDLQIIMRYLEHWAHRLFPKMPFDEVLERIEKLGTKNEVKTCIKRMRLDMPILNEDFVDNNEEEEDSKDNRAIENDVDADAEEAFDEMIRAEAETEKQTQSSPPKSKTSPPKQMSQLATQLSLPLSQNPSDPMSKGTPRANGTVQTSASQGLTPEQRERIERNKRLAMEKRMGKQGGTFKTPAPPSPRTPSRKTTPQSAASSPQSALPSTSFSPARSNHGSYTMPSLPCSSPHKYHQTMLEHSSHSQSSSEGSGTSQATFRSLLEPSMDGSSSEMSTIHPFMNGHFAGQGPLSMNSCQDNLGSHGMSSEGYFPGVLPGNSQEMSEVFPMPQPMHYTPSSTMNSNAGLSASNQSIPLVNVESKVYADLSSPKKAKLDVSQSSDQMSEEELMLRLSESD